jgi:hypothetical protein
MASFDSPSGELPSRSIETRDQPAPGNFRDSVYRLLDQANYSKSVDQLVSLLQALDYEVDLRVRARTA